MKVKELKYWLSLINDDEVVKLNIGGRTTELASIDIRDAVYLCCHNYGCDDNEITMANVLNYLKMKK